MAQLKQRTARALEWLEDGQPFFLRVIARVMLAAILMTLTSSLFVILFVKWICFLTGAGNSPDAVGAISIIGGLLLGAIAGLIVLGAEVS